MTQAVDLSQQFETFAKLYQAVSSAVNALQIPPKFKEYVSLNFDQGFLWAKEAFQAVSNAQQNAVQNSEHEIAAEVVDALQSE